MEDKDSLGVTTLMSNTWTAGSAKYSENDIAGIIEGCAGSISAFGGRNSTGMTLESLAIHAPKALDVFSDVMSTPAFPDEAVAREASVQAEYIRTRGDHPSSVASQLFMENIFRGHPYAEDLLGTIDSLKTITASDVKAHWQNMVNSNNAVLVAVGDFDLEKQFDYFEQASRKWAPGRKHEEKFSVEPLKDTKIFSKSEKEQSHIIVGYRGLSFHDKDRYILDVLEAILAGQGGRLFLELRDKASLAYTVSPFHMKGIETGYFGVYIGCSPEKGPKAIEMIHAELEKIVDREPQDIEVQRAKRYLVGRNHIDLQRNGAQASSILFDELYGIDCEETFRFAEHLKEITPADVQRVAQRFLKAPAVTVAVGPIQPWSD